MLPPASNCLDAGGFEECFKYSKVRERLAREQLVHDSRSIILGDALLLGGVPVPYGDGAVLEGVVVDGDAPGGSDLVHTGVPLTDGSGSVVVGLDPVGVDALVDGPGHIVQS